MSLLATRKFNVEAVESLESVSRAARRIIINADILKQAKVYAGDVVGLSSADSHKVPQKLSDDRSRMHEPTDQACFSLQAFAVGVAWPSSELSQDGTCPCPCAACVREGDIVSSAE